ncbi:MAG: nitroreductase family protein [Bacteroidaceae bacterium]|nr:nitroreductase family protein [Bacteroidaceae bacterium]
MNSFSELIKMRRSMRKFTDELLSADEARLLLRAALMSPSSKGLHAWEFVVVEDKATLEMLSQCKSQGADFLSGAPLAVVVLGDPQVSDVWIEDASVAATQMLLQAEDLGLGACWIQVRDRHDAEGGDAEENVRRILGIPDQLRVLAIVAVGHKGMERKPFNEDRLLWEKVHVYSPMLPCF